MIHHDFLYSHIKSSNQRENQYDKIQLLLIYDASANDNFPQSVLCHHQSFKWHKMLLLIMSLQGVCEAFKADSCRGC